MLKPLLPTAAKLMPYLQRIDASRVYTNWGPLVTELSQRLGAAFGVNPQGVVCASSGMSALTGAILGAAGRATATRPLAIVPDFTFTATGLAAQICGYELVIASCDRKTWTFSPDELLARADLDRVGLVIPVAPFGRSLEQQAWLDFQTRTGIPVVLDGAACFEALVGVPRMPSGPLPLALSFHATKAFATGEGGCVVSTDAHLADRIVQCLNFGFFGSRDTEIAGINGKMPEYAAAVGLAELDDWPRKHKRAQKVFAAYASHGPLLKGARLWGPPDISSSYILLECRSARQAAKVAGALAAGEVGTRFWYGAGLGAHEAFKGSARLALHGGHAVDPRTVLGLPVAVDLTAAQVRTVCALIQQCGD